MFCGFHALTKTSETEPTSSDSRRYAQNLYLLATLTNETCHLIAWLHGCVLYTSYPTFSTAVQISWLMLLTCNIGPFS